jgi:hypothetical protein
MPKIEKFKAPKYRTLTTNKGQFIVNMAEAEDGKVEIFKPSPKQTGQLIQIADIELPKDLRKADDHIEGRKQREHILKEIRRIENFVAARAEFERGAINLKNEVEPELLGIEEDLRRAPTDVKRSKRT